MSGMDMSKFSFLEPAKKNFKIKKDLKIEAFQKPEEVLSEPQIGSCSVIKQSKSLKNIFSFEGQNNEPCFLEPSKEKLDDPNLIVGFLALPNK